MNESSANNPTGDSRDDSAGHELLAGLAEDFAGRYRRGEHPSIEDYAQRHPGLAQQIRELFPAMLALEQSSGAAMVDHIALSETVGTMIGRYKLLERIGEGGFGVVFMAEQQHPIHRKVALKVIKAGMDTRQIIGRFEAERQALTMMDHPNIAKVLDAGATEAGRPYFVMELVKGIPITTYCDQARLTTRERLELMIQVCNAVQHAHTKGVIHRDLKPTNVLVTLHDNKPVPKVIDFGIAKATGQQLTDKTLFTNYAQMLGTPLYMSPEQAQLSGLDVDTRSDVYSLGVLLYELLTGTTPFDKQRLREAAYDEMRRIIREEDPPKPSTRLSTMGGRITAVSADRQTDPKHLGQVVHGELDWIVMKALEKDRTRRYETAIGLALDIGRHLRDEPVQACPPSTRYRMRKFVSRNRGPVVAVMLVAATLTLGTIVSTWQAFRAQKANKAEVEQRHVADVARKAAEKQSELAETNLKKARAAVDEYFTLTSESRLLDVPGMQPLRKELLEAALRYYQAMQSERADDPAVLADLVVAHLHVANVYHELDRNDDSLASIERAVTLAERLHQDHPNAIEQHRRLAGYWKAFRGADRVTTMPKDPRAAHRTLTRFLQLWEVLARENPSVAAFKNDLASINALLANLEGGRGAAGDSAGFSRGVAYARNAVAIWEELDRAHPDVPRHRENLAMAYGELAWNARRAGDVGQAREASAREKALKETLISQFPMVPTYRALAAVKCMDLAVGLADSQPEKADAAFRLALKDWQTLSADFPQAHEYAIGFARAECQFAATLAGPLKRPDDAMAVFRVANERLKELAAQYPDEPRYRRELALAPRRLAERLGRLKDRLFEAEKLHLQSLAVLDELIKESPKDPDLWEMEGHSYRYLGWIARETGRIDEALKNFDCAVSCFEKVYGADAVHKGVYYRGYLADTLMQKVYVLTGAGRAGDADQALRRAVDVYESLMRERPDDAQWRQQAVGGVRQMASLRANDGRQQDAAQVYRDAIARLGDVAGGPQVDLYRGTLHRDSGELDKAIADYSAAIAVKPDVVEAWDLRGNCYLRKAEFAKAAQDYSRAIKLQPDNPWYWHERAFAYMVVGEYRKSIADHSEAIQLNGRDASALLRRGDCYRAIGEWTKAETDYTRSIDLNRTDWGAWYGRATTYLQLKQDDRAASDFGRAIELKPDRWEAWSGRAFSSLHRQQWKAAVSDFSKAIDLAPEVHTNWFHRGHAYLNLEEWDKAAADFTKVVERWPTEPEGWYLRGVAYAQMGKPDKALSDLTQAVAKGFKDVGRMENDPRLQPLRGNDDFNKLLSEVGQRRE